MRECAPSVETVGLLVELAGEGLSARGRIDALGAFERHIAWLQGLQVELLAAIGEYVESGSDAASVGEDFDTRQLREWDSTSDEVACALRLASDTGSRRLVVAQQLCSRYPATLALLKSGDISYLQAQAMTELCAVLEPATAGQVEAVMLTKMPALAVGQTRAALRRQIHKADPDGAEERHRRRKQDRETVCYPQDDGMALFGAVLPAQQAAQMEQAVDAHAATFDNDGRTLAQKRADALYDLVVNRAGAVADCGVPARGRASAVVQVTVPLDVLVGADDGPADLKGYGPITAGQAREIAFAPGTIWRRLITDPGSGLLVKADPTTYRPTADAERQVIARDQYCAFPSCRMPAHRCDVDHVRPFDHERPEAGGLTVPENLQPLCRRHHRLKTHHPGWKVARDPRTGIARWTSPTGHTYSNAPPVYRE
ncbi:HNH endonuclease [Streptomyces sp. HG99]|nr:HNH endonuclease [Streptomyces sp. HG99]